MMGPKAIRNGKGRLVQAQAHRPPPHLIAPALLLSHFALTLPFSVRPHVSLSETYSFSFLIVS